MDIEGLKTIDSILNFLLSFVYKILMFTIVLYLYFFIINIILRNLSFMYYTILIFNLVYSYIFDNK